MVRDYQAGMYAPAARGGAALSANECSGARELAQWKRRVRAAWPGVTLAHAGEVSPVLSRTEQLQLRVAVQLNGLSNDDVALEFVAQRRLPHDASEPPPLCSYGAVDESGTWQAPLTPARAVRADGATVYEFAGVPPASGQYSMVVRLRPANRLLSHPMEMGLLKTL
jgi:starch phosphorylase